MITNKVAIAINSHTRLGATATAFDGKRASRDFLRYKNGVLYTKLVSRTKFLAALGHKPSREKIRQQAVDAMKQLACMVDTRWGEGTSARIGLNAYGRREDGSVHVLSGRTVADLNVHAAADTALHELGQMADATAADREAAVQSVKAYLQEAMDRDPNIGVKKAAREGAFRFALLQHLQGLERDGTMKNVLPRDLAQSAELTTQSLMNSELYGALDAASLTLAQQAYSAKGSCSPEAMRVLAIEGDLAQADAAQAKALMQPEFKAVIEAISALPNAFRDNSAIGTVLSARARTTAMNMVVAQMVDALMSDADLQAQIAPLGKYSNTYKDQCAAAVRPKLMALLKQTPPERLTEAFCQDVHMGLEVIGEAHLKDGIDREALETAWLINAFGLRLLTPAIATYISTADETLNRYHAATGIAAGLQKVLNDPAFNGDYLAYMRAVAERGRATAA